MANEDGTVAVPTGQNIETSELTLPDGTGAVVERQRVAEADAYDLEALALVTRAGERLVTDKTVAEAVVQIAEDIRAIRFMLERITHA